MLDTTASFQNPNLLLPLLLMNHRPLDFRRLRPLLRDRHIRSTPLAVLEIHWDAVAESNRWLNSPFRTSLVNGIASPETLGFANIRLWIIRES